MSDPWLSILGLGEDGLDGLSLASRRALETAEVIFGGPRHLDLVAAGGRGRAWPVPFEIAPVLDCRGRATVVLASGDPFWFGAGSMLAERLTPGEWRAFPVPGVVSLLCARLGWRVEETAALGLHAAPFGRLLPVLGRGQRAVVTLRDGAAVADLAGWLVANGLGAVRMAVAERLGGPAEMLRSIAAQDYDLTDVSAPVTVALDGADLAPGTGLSQVPGRAESAFAHDGQITKSPMRALTLAALAPRRGELLWDIGGGSGSVSVEWCLAGGRAITIEPRVDRIDNIQKNIDTYGLSPRMRAVQGTAPAALADLPPPQAVFIGGGGSQALYDRLWELLAPGTRIVANAVTLESETLLTQLHARHGGQLLRIDIAQAEPLGRMRGWSPSRPQLQWSGQR
ncbi:bifunctional cobalt-precorrin-7 (C(5))-methyltransferase/cobalt-precorrin-6B (C(15))-methyltransferase [Rhodobacter capsulatus]|uniref:bifunctional cobalt-precorrin-7 (C(5))-methyltransferase/cobalt-precorrin-6B (C(15))-methyltransferase n=1 Tax=Rhodobacter capsulatus TaxID=1061 RepID=UPI0003D3666E|nr:bifunctional cobalt-precorrin-7 (C(5))-methyltransferase/cobalt-precorrin-6B (C(15))-methyltransferase [Rhodobacter capsulatus]ETD88541.1 precorrin-6y methyltransferase [Rhodobacter capsulatus YW2]